MKQSKFEGSFRQIRGAILKHLACYFAAIHTDFYEQIPREKRHIDKALEQLMQEGFIQESGGKFFIGSQS